MTVIAVPFLADDSIPPGRRTVVDNLLLYVRDQMPVGERITSSELAKRASKVIPRGRLALGVRVVMTVMKNCPYVEKRSRGYKVDGKRVCTTTAMWERVEYPPKEKTLAKEEIPTKEENNA